MAQTKELITSFRFRQDTLANWNLANPILKDGEFILIKDTAEYKVGNGVSKFSELPVRGLPAVQDKGQSILNVMSQKAVTDELNRLDGVDTAQTSEINAVKSGKIDKSSILSTFPTVEPTDHTTLVSAKEAYKKVKEISDKNTQLEQDVNLFNRKPQGLRFKAQDNTVFAKTMKALVLGTDDFTVCVVARSEGSSGNNDINQLFGFSKTHASPSSLRIYNTPSSKSSNGVGYITTELGNTLNMGKTDNSYNLHHIVITRSGTLVTCTINGRLVKSVTQDRVLDFSNFIYDIANTSYFWGGYVFNYAMTQAESNKLLWNGGRYDEVKLGSEWRPSVLKEIPDINNWIANSCGKEVFTNSGITGIKYISTGQILYVGANSIITKACPGEYVIIKFKLFMNDSNSFEPSVSDIAFGGLYNVKKDNIEIDKTKVQQWQDVVIKGAIIANNGKWYIDVKSVGNWYAIANVEVIRGSVLLEYRPENIRSDRYLNSGTAGSDYDLVYSNVKPEIIYEKPYTDKVMLDENKAPDWHPIAMGQEVETPTNIFKAKLPDLGKEWQVSDWKQINN